MKYSGIRVLLCLAFLLFPVLTFAATVTVDCSGATPGAFTSLQQAISSSPDHTTFLVSGTCTENVDVDRRSDLNILGNPTATVQAADPTLEVLVISASQAISFSRGITFSGGQGVVVVISTSVRFDNVTVQNSGNFGLSTADAVVHISRSTVTTSTRSGIVVSGGAVYLDGGVNASNNGRLGSAPMPDT